jgi:hypothetical protein
MGVDCHIDIEPLWHPARPSSLLQGCSVHKQTCSNF